MERFLKAKYDVLCIMSNLQRYDMFGNVITAGHNYTCIKRIETVTSYTCMHIILE